MKTSNSTMLIFGFFVMLIISCGGLSLGNTGIEGQWIEKQSCGLRGFPEIEFLKDKTAITYNILNGMESTGLAGEYTLLDNGRIKIEWNQGRFIDVLRYSVSNDTLTLCDGDKCCDYQPVTQGTVIQPTTPFEQESSADVPTKTASAPTAIPTSTASTPTTIPTSESLPIKDDTNQADIKEQIAFSSWYDYQTQIFVIATDGNNLIKLTDFHELTGAEQPIWSPNGEKIVFRAWREDKDKRKVNDIYVMNADGSGLVKLAEHSSFIGWFPDSKKILYHFPGQGDPTQFQLYTIDIDGSNSKKLTDDPQGVSYGLLSPDGEKILYSKREETYLLNAITGEQVKLDLNLPAGNLYLSASKWFPDGERLLLVLHENEQVDSRNVNFSQVYVIGIDGSNLQKLVRTPTQGEDVIENVRENIILKTYWSPDGTKIAIGTQMENDAGQRINEGYVVNADGNQLIKVTSTGINGWSSDSKKVLFSDGSQCYAVDSDGKNEVELINLQDNPKGCYSPQWRPNTKPITGQNQIIGVWQSKGNNGTMDYQFFEDGSFQWIGITDDGEKIIFNGSYNLNGSELFYEITEIEPPFITLPLGKHTSYIEISRDKLTLIDEDGQREEAVRISK